MVKPADLISKDYLRTQQELHGRPRGYGGKGAKWADTVEAVAKAYEAFSILDYGCGRGTLGDALRARGWHVREYDPAIPGKDSLPGFADLVVSTDVLEHVEPEKLGFVLTHLRQLARKAVFVVISTREANKTLSDGRNAHLIVQPGDWWRERMQDVGFRLAPVPPIHRDKPAREWVAVLIP